MQIGEFISNEQLEKNQLRQTNVYLKCDSDLIDILCFADKLSYIMADLPQEGTTISIQVCSMSKVG